MDSNLIIVTGFLGSPITDFAKSLAADRGYSFMSLDDEIVKKDGWSISRICMMNGEHAYRNKEYEMLNEIDSDLSSFLRGTDGLVVACGDGLLYDEMSRDIAMKHELLITGKDTDLEELWKGAREIKNSYHAFLNFGSEEDKRAAFDKFIERQKKLFSEIDKEDSR